MSILTDASTQWYSRPADERFVNLLDMQSTLKTLRRNSADKVIANRHLSAAPVDGVERGLALVGPNGAAVMPTHWSFGQLASRIGAPAGYLRDLAPALAADCINWGLQRRDVEELKVLLRRPNGHTDIAAITGPNYGRIWNDRIVDSLVKVFGDGINGEFRVPGEFGRRVDVTKANTTLFAGDRDMFVFLADEVNKIEVPNRRDGAPGQLSRGFFVRNSDVGAATFEIDTFLFDYTCSNRIVWGVSDHAKVSFRHSKGAPERFAEQVAPALSRMHNESTHNIVASIAAAKAERIGKADDVDTFLLKRFTKSQTSAIKAAHLADEGRPIESLWDVATGATAYARGIEYQDARFEVERAAGKVLDLVKVNGRDLAFA